MSKLVVVESPGKVKTIQKYLGDEYVVKASVGHCFQINPVNNAIDIDNGYEPTYIVIPKKKSVVSEIKDLAKKSELCYIASDPDREGEAIGWHIAKRVIKGICPVKRISFREITKSAVLTAIKNPRQLDESLFNAQQARSVLDFLVGFKVSPVLWRKVCSGTSAGRVQSIGLKLIAERQAEIDVFKPEEYWDITGKFSTQSKKEITATYKSDTKLTTEGQVNSILDSINKSKKWIVKSVAKAKKKRAPTPLFNTASLQQFGSSTFGWDGNKTMSLAQHLYEGASIAGHEQTGLITYHRTDSLNISSEAMTDVRTFIKDQIGTKYLSDSPRVFKSKNVSAQEAHEGIRPSHLEFSLEDVRRSLDDDEYKLYEAIYYKFISCQMSDAEFDATKIEIISENNHLFIANGQILSFDGFLKFWPYGTTKEELLPLVNENDELTLNNVKGEQHFTKPPAAFNTASLVKTLEEQGVGRPSTYATIVSTLLKRTYVEKDGKAFVPTELGKRVAKYLSEAFPELMNINFTARIEEQLDEIATNGQSWVETVHSFFIELKKRLKAAGEDNKAKGETTDIICPQCKTNKLVKRFSRFGSFYGCEGYKLKGDEQCKATFKIDNDGQPLKVEKKEVRYLEGVTCDKCGSKIVIRTGNKSGKEFGGCAGFPKCRRMFSMDGEPIEFKKKSFKKKKKKNDE